MDMNNEIPTPKEVISKKEKTRESFRALYAIATRKSQLMRSEDQERAKPDTRLDLIEYCEASKIVNGSEVISGKVEYYICREHVEIPQMLRNIYYYKGMKSNEIKFRYWRPVYKKANGRNFETMEFCNRDDRRAEPITVGYV